MNTWTSYRDGRRVMHYLQVAEGRYYVQKVEEGYSVSFMADKGDGVSFKLCVAASLSAGKAAAEGAAEGAEQHPTLADIKAKFDDEPLYECEIPGAPGRVTRCGADITPAPAVEYAFASPGQDPETLQYKPLGATALLATVEWDSAFQGGERISNSVVVLPAESFHMQMFGRIRRAHRPKRYNTLTLGIDRHKVLSTITVKSIDAGEALMRQDVYLCRIEQELLQYDGKRRTPNLDLKVKKLSKIMRALKRGIYE